MFRTIVGLCLLSLFPAAVVLADTKNIETHGTPQTAAVTVDFNKELGLASPSLRELGMRIDQARAACDPIGLATAASELAALEKATGKNADIRSDALAAEAIKLAQERNQSAELKAVAAILPDQATAADLTEAADAAAKAEVAAAADKQSGSKSRGIGESLHVDSRVGEPVNIFVNGVYVGQVSPAGDGYMHVGLPYGTTVLHGVGVIDGTTWDMQVSDVVGDFTWIMYP